MHNNKVSFFLVSLATCFELRYLEAAASYAAFITILTARVELKAPGSTRAIISSPIPWSKGA